MQVAAKQMVGLYLGVWTTQAMLPQIRGLQVTAVGTGLMGYLGNKGDTCQHLLACSRSRCLPIIFDELHCKKRLSAYQ